MPNICNYEPLGTISKREIDRRFSEIHRYLCYVGAALTSLTTTTTTTA